MVLNRHAGDLRWNQKDLGMASWIRKNAGLVGIFQLLLLQYSAAESIDLNNLLDTLNFLSARR